MLNLGFLKKAIEGIKDDNARVGYSDGVLGGNFLLIRESDGTEALIGRLEDMSPDDYGDFNDDIDELIRNYDFSHGSEAEDDFDELGD